MKHARPRKQLVQTLPPRQQTLDFGDGRLWEQLPAADRQACRDSLAALLRHVTVATRSNEEPTHQEKNDHE